MKALIATFRLILLCSAMCVAFPMVAMATPADDTLATAVKHKLMSGVSDFDATNVIVTSKNGVIYLGGEIKSVDDAAKAVKAAGSVPGVKDVKDNILVGY